MTTIAQLQSLLGQSTAATSPTPAGSAASAQDRFLKLLVTQMQNQDPLNPMDNAQITTQLAQLNTVTGIEQLNKTLSQMAAASAGQQSLQAATLIGRDVMVAGSQLNFSGQPVNFGVDLAQAVDSLTINIADAKGNRVGSFQTGAQPAGATTLQWDGLDASGKPLAQGAYTASATAVSGGAAVAATPLVSASINSVSNAADGSIQLQLANGGNVGIGDIKRFL